jgi:hypothetical protein
MGITKAVSIIDRFSDKMLSSLERKYQKLSDKVAAYNKKSLQRLQKQELKLAKQLAGKDSLAAKQLLHSSQDKYAAQLAKLNRPADKLNAGSLNDYMPGLDSLSTTFNFLEKSGSKIPELPADKLKQVQAVSVQIKSLQSQVQNAADLKKFLRERKELLKQQLDRFGLGDKLKTIFAAAGGPGAN